MDDQIWTADNTNPVQLTHYRAKRPCHVSLIKQFDARDVEDDKEDEFLDYIENCSGMYVKAVIYFFSTFQVKLFFKPNYIFVRIFL